MPTVVLLTPGVHNSAYFEHSFLARHMGIELVEGGDLLCHDDVVYMRTTQGLQRVDVIYRRVDDEFLDPLIFRKDSMLGAPGLLNAYRAGNVTLANAPGHRRRRRQGGLPLRARDDPLLPRARSRSSATCRPTSACTRPTAATCSSTSTSSSSRRSNGSGGYGMLIGPVATDDERELFRRQIEAEPREFIAQPTIALSRMPIYLEELRPAHVDLRPFVLSSRITSVVPGGLTRAALREGSLVVNSSQGGGSKDTWVLRS